jgi:hypothetical protein
MTVADYQALVSSKNADQPNFLAVIAANVAPSVQVQALLQAMISLFDLDAPPVGDQLDIIGKWVGVSRRIKVPISGVFFTWDGAANVGWDYGIWQGAGQTSNISSLPDDAYLRLIKATIAANNWNGTTNGAYAIWDALFTTFTILIQDNLNMSYAMAIVGGIIDSLTLALITGGYIHLRPEGVMISKYYVSQGAHPVFAWDLNVTNLQGWDVGYWATEIAGT